MEAQLSALYRSISLPSSPNFTYYEDLYHINHLATTVHGLFVLGDPKTILFVPAPTLSDVSRSDSKLQSHILTPSPAIDFSIHTILSNKTQTLLAIVGSTDIVVAEVGELSEKKLICRTRRLELPLGLNSSPVHIIKAAWHPLSATHLVVLTSNTCLMLFNVASSDPRPEQSYQIPTFSQSDSEHLSVSGNERGTVELPSVVNFAFGDTSTLNSWQTFTIYLMRNNATLLALCPIVPYDAHISSQHFVHLAAKLESQLSTRESALLHSDIDSMTLQRYKLQLKWLYTVVPALVTHSQGSEIITQNPTLTISALRAIPQEPIETSTTCIHEMQSKLIRSVNVPVCDLTVISSSPTILLRTHASGHVEILLLTEHEIEPYFAHLSAKLDPPPLPEMLFYSGVDLTPYSGVLNKPKASQVQHDLCDPNSYLKSLTPITCIPDTSTVRDIHDPHIFLYGSSGIVKLHLPWLPHLTSAFLDPQLISSNSLNSTSGSHLQKALRYTTDDLPMTTVEIIWNFKPVAAALPHILGLAPWIRPLGVSNDFSHTAVLVLLRPKAALTRQILFATLPKTPQFSLINETSTNTQSTVRSNTDTKDLSKDNDGTKTKQNFNTELTRTPSPDPSILYSNVIGNIEEWSHTPPRLGPGVLGVTEPNVDWWNSPALCAYLTQHTSTLLTCGNAFNTAAINIKTRVELLSQEAQEQTSEFETLNGKMQRMAQTQVVLVDKLRKAIHAHETLKKRMDAIRIVLRTVAVVEDDSFIKQLKTLETSVAAQQAQLDKLTTLNTQLIEQTQPVQIQPIAMQSQEDQLQTQQLLSTLESHKLRLDRLKQLLTTTVTTD